MKFLISQKISVNKEEKKYDSLDQSYSYFFNQLGITLLPIDNIYQDAESLLKVLQKKSEYHGVILSGSGDIKKVADYDYEHKTHSYYEERDKTENILIKFAISNNYPLLGICHGMQKINDYFGGNIRPYYHCMSDTYSKNGTSHKIIGEDNFIGKGKEYTVNQFHDHCILAADLAENFACFAKDPRFDTVEGFYNLKQRTVAIQWHPERTIIDKDISKTVFKKIL